jgi:hypothetical protein
MDVNSQARRLVQKVGHAPSRIRRVPDQLRRISRSLATEPIETLLYVPEQVGRRFDRPVAYDVEEDWGLPFHRMLGLPWPCPELDSVRRLWGEIGADLTARGLSFGRYTYGQYSDADAALGAATWCAVRHLRPAKVLETGVARGATSRVILEALSSNGDGHLWSVDLPHLFAPELHGETAAAVPDGRHDRWTYVRGSSRRRLPQLLSRMGQIDMFVHDSLHTARNMSFEMKTVWPALRGGGIMLVDDVYNQAFRDFVREADRQDSMVCRSADGTWMFGVIRKGGPNPVHGRD